MDNSTAETHKGYNWDDPSCGNLNLVLKKQYFL